MLPYPSRSAARSWVVESRSAHSQPKTVMVALGIHSILFPQRKRGVERNTISKRNSLQAEEWIDNSMVFHILSTPLSKSMAGLYFPSSVKFKRGLYDFLSGQSILWLRVSFSLYLSVGMCTCAPELPSTLNIHQIKGLCQVCDKKSHVMWKSVFQQLTGKCQLLEFGICIWALARGPSPVLEVPSASWKNQIKQQPWAYSNHSSFYHSFISLKHDKMHL